MEKTRIRRDLSGIYIFDKFEGEEQREPTVFEDCNEETQDKQLDTLETKKQKRLSKQLAQTIREIGDNFDIFSKYNQKI